ncbi:restriction endonuclease subunit S [Leuconostoc suionicum]|uniref:restriction endonuclease subunit S n=3 Tax=Leuconostoc suionicum TaxID=1511761 RepID=UPI0024AD7CB0|nr:restriction endonuclease subunit S [Leuconostoc suionicum]MDI6498886.1 restriction endonuclease subunit S [Leuconostoc suionicum]MDI6502408.1 restriction endonuclease subunit S [Leuconostoc suionicum]
MSKMTPQIRFQGFTDDWEERKLGEVTTSYSGGTPSAGNASYYQGDIPFIRSGEINSSTTELFLTEEGLSNSSAKLVEVGDILYALYGATSGEVGISKINGAINQAVLAIKPTEGYESQFIMQWLKLQKQKIIDRYLQGGQGNLSGSIVKALCLEFPNLEEQQKIGAFFKQLDDTIALHQRKLDLLKEQKKGFLQKMFPKNGARVPELRFEGFTDDWEERKLGELSNIVGGGTPSTSNPEYWDGDIDWYAPAEIGEQSYVSKSKKTITELGLKKSSARILPVGTVLFTSRAGIGNTAILGKEATTNQGFQSIVPDQNKLDSYFIYSRTNALKRYGEVTGAGSTFVEVSGKQMSKMSIMVPELSEQQQIGSFFKQLDNTIALHQRKLNLLTEQKKGFLQKMFVS